MQVVFNKKEKELLAIKLYQDGKPIQAPGITWRPITSTLGYDLFECQIAKLKYESLNHTKSG